jgi:hypothetical protein
MKNDHAEENLPFRRRGLTRREWGRRMMAGAAAGIAAPALREARGAMAALPEAPAAEESTPSFFDVPQNETLIALAERIVPGSTGAHVNRFLDAAVSADTQEGQKKFVSSLNALEGESLHRFSASFKDLSASQQDEVLTAASTAQPSSPTLDTVAEGISGKQPAVPSLRDYFENLKDWISMAYYSSEAGMKELGWTGENFFESLPACEHDSHS